MKIDRSKKFTEFFEKKNEARKIDFLVLHHVEANSLERAIEQFKEHQVSSHFLIDESGKIFELVDENDVAYHAGISFWRGCDGLNKNSIGIEFINSTPLTKKFEAAQMQAGVELCKYLIAKYEIEARNVVGHSDVAYKKENGFLNRKQDPSHLFDWQFLAENAVGVFPKISVENRKLWERGDKSSKLVQIKKNLQKFGYRVVNLNEEFDEEMQALALVFNRRFLGEEMGEWSLKSGEILNALIS